MPDPLGVLTTPAHTELHNYVKPVGRYIVTITPPVVLQLSDPFEGYIVTITSPVVLQLSDPFGGYIVKITSPVMLQLSDPLRDVLSQ